MSLPLFPLNTLLFPQGYLPLRIFEARYLDMVSYCLRENAEFGVLLVEGQGEDAVMHRVGTTARIIDFNQQDDGLLGIVAEGVDKFRLDELSEQADGLLLGDITRLPAELDAAMPAEFLSLSTLLGNILNDLGEPFNTMNAQLDSTAWVAGRLTELLPLSLPVKQELLELDDPLVRLFHLRDAMTKLEIG